MFAVTFVDCVQIGPDTWREKSVAKLFEDDAKMSEVFAWAKTLGAMRPDFSHLIFSEATP